MSLRSTIITVYVHFIFPFGPNYSHPLDPERVRRHWQVLIQDETGINPNLQRLSLQGVSLEDDRSLAYYERSFAYESNLQLLRKQRLIDLRPPGVLNEFANKAM